MIIDQQSDFDRVELSFEELDQGYTPRQAIAEAKRCLQCAKPACRQGCPVENDIPQFIRALALGNIGEASAIIARRSNLPAVCGRVCPHEKQCEGRCILHKKGQPIHIGKLERFIADFDAEMAITQPTACPVLNKGKVAVIGSGPAGLTVAGDLAKQCFAVTVFDALEEPGGVLMYGIPDFRLNKEVVRREIRKIENLGVTFRTGVLIGQDLTIDDLFADGYDAVFIGTGTAVPKTLDVPGNELPGVMQAAYFLRIVALANAGKVSHREIPVSIGDHVFVVGAGNVAMDAARTAVRVGAARVTVIYRRSEADMTALQSEYESAQSEGVQFRWMSSPTQCIGDDMLTGIELETMEFTNDDRRRLIATGQKETLRADKIILAIGQRPAARIISTTGGIEVNPHGYVITREKPYGMTTRKGVFAGGDVVHEPATVVLAMKAAKKVAAGIVMYVEAKKLLEEL
ncbi:NAD(P)-dependent oxidoreductase [Heliophilum fasciatum]|uniref:Glutamate synthase (NADPH/NADH) small chain n=1 Tax=Heliophilum fasciatum TaxID=35700 RepID=A0A4R2RVR8_9FIRM|nr:NAD(P)-dependent oxidoreductase [Heliophilum fasciatum]MCW2276964.1 glutamate synthase (NADPH/NADH) small chain [Heliophilum fasciatum]TCP68510.1 glutamate synthase (NADPH/NADH) small chain [Heliophilum fasciatum]